MDQLERARAEVRGHGASARLEINSYTNADMLPDFDEPKRFPQHRKRPAFFEPRRVLWRLGYLVCAAASAACW